MSDNDEREHPRYRLRYQGKLSSSEKAWQAHVLNLSAHGALIALIDDHSVEVGEELRLEIETSDISVLLSCTVAHVKRHYVGLACKPVNDEDKENLKSLIEKKN